LLGAELVEVVVGGDVAEGGGRLRRAQGTPGRDVETAAVGRARGRRRRRRLAPPAPDEAEQAAADAHAGRGEQQRVLEELATALEERLRRDLVLRRLGARTAHSSTIPQARSRRPPPAFPAAVPPRRVPAAPGSLTIPACGSACIRPRATRSRSTPSGRSSDATAPRTCA